MRFLHSTHTHLGTHNIFRKKGKVHAYVSFLWLKKLAYNVNQLNFSPFITPNKPVALRPEFILVSELSP